MNFVVFARTHGRNGLATSRHPVQLGKLWPKNGVFEYVRILCVNSNHGYKCYKKYCNDLSFGVCKRSTFVSKKGVLWARSARGLGVSSVVTQNGVLEYVINICDSQN